jgi:hypothetical protein
MQDLNQIRQTLHGRRLDIVSTKCGVHRNILAAIRDGRNQNPSYKTVKAVSDYLDFEPFGYDGGADE